MALVVKNNMSALNTLNIMNKNNKALSSSLQKVSSGMKINSAADNPAGYSISERMLTQVASLDQDNDNAKKGQDMLKTAEGSVSSTVDILKTLKQKVLDSANDTNTDSDRKTIQDYLDQAVDQINDNANTTYNGKMLVDGSQNKEMNATFVRYTNSSFSSTVNFNTALTALTDSIGRNLNIVNADKITISFVANGKTVTTTFSVVGNSAGHATTLNDIFDKLNAEAKKSSVIDNAAFAYNYDASGNTVINGGNTQVSYEKVNGKNVGITGRIAGSVIGTTAEGVTLYTSDGKNALTIGSKVAGLTGTISGFTISVTGTDGNIKKSSNAVLDNWNETITAEDKSTDNALTYQIGTRANQAIKVGLSDMRARALGLQGINSNGTVQNLDVTNRANANAAISVLDNAVSKALKEQTKIGSVESRLDYTQDNLSTQSENIQASESTIRDANMAKEMTEYTKNNVLAQASQAMLAQANQSSQNVLQLLQ